LFIIYNNFFIFYKIEEIISRSHVPIVCGGTSYYIESLITRNLEGLKNTNIDNDEVKEEKNYVKEIKNSEKEEINVEDEKGVDFDFFTIYPPKVHPHDIRKNYRFGDSKRFSSQFSSSTQSLLSFPYDPLFIVLMPSSDISQELLDKSLVIYIYIDR
jgi:tRNA A37 N6-isopentenylltransferase MiaA